MSEVSMHTLCIKMFCRRTVFPSTTLQLACLRLTGSNVKCNLLRKFKVLRLIPSCLSSSARRENTDGKCQAHSNTKIDNSIHTSILCQTDRCILKFNNAFFNYFTLDFKNRNNQTLRYLSTTSNFCCISKKGGTKDNNELDNTSASAKKAQSLPKFSLRKENIYTVPNFLCMTRIVLAPIISYSVLNGSFGLGLLLFSVAGATDLLDGYIARNFKNQQSVMGSFLDPVADKLLVVTLFLSLTATNLIPLPLTILIVVRDIGLFGAGLIVRYISLPDPKTVKRYFDVSYATAEISPTVLSKLNTGAQLLLVAITLGSPVFGYVDHPCFPYLWYATAGSTILSGLSYIFSKNSYQIFKPKEKN